MSGIQHQSIIVTGAAGGLGRATGLGLSRGGARLCITDLDAEGLEQTAQAVKRGGASGGGLPGDITNEKFAEALVALAQRTHDGIDALCNVAGICDGGPIEAVTGQAFDRTMQINCYAQLQLISKALPMLRASSRASIVNVSSIGGLTALPHLTVYCASKAAVIGMTRAVAAELAPRIRCNAVCPGGIDTQMSRGFLMRFSQEEQLQMIPKLTGRQLQKRFASADEIAAAVVFLTSDEASFITGTIMPVDGGVTAW